MVARTTRHLEPQTISQEMAMVPEEMYPETQGIKNRPEIKSGIASLRLHECNPNCEKNHACMLNISSSNSIFQPFNSLFHFLH